MIVCDAIVVAAGRGTRIGGTIPKQYLPVAGKPLLRWSIEALAGHRAIRAVHAVIAADDLATYAAAVAGLSLPSPVLGAATRQGSVLAGLEALSADPPDMVAIHDGARPLVPGASIDAAIEAIAAGSAAGAVVAVPVADTLKRVEAGVIRDTVPRDGLWRMQTPQVFRYADILAAHRSCAGLAAAERTALSDDAAVAERAGLSVVVVAGKESNLKVTNPPDVELAERLLEGRGARVETRTGFGFDVHAFDTGSEVVLCGVRIPHERRLSGHSDADVALHALTDAVLGALAEADIGKHFPPSDARWKGADSATFLRHAVELLDRRRGRLVHVDVTIVCEAPRIGPHRDAMRESVAGICGIAVGRVSVKATTTERLGFTGRSEGIAAQAVATIELPVGE